MKLVVLLLLSIAPASFAVLVTMPEKKILHDRLCEMGFEHFVEKTEIDEKLGGQTKEALGVAVVVELALYDYNELTQNPMMEVIMQEGKNKLFEALLQDEPKALEELAKNGLYQAE